ncbi:hypothetical protein CRG98_000192 [Punica granatum]|uniref:Uncharacterized protein n=1 Tax=Punica granatum TaxID=22663 RepID=A0A2I0LFJ6_PUNGR|nr:hypothetical protein CRG98_000192 [Punica granatum]
MEEIEERWYFDLKGSKEAAEGAGIREMDSGEKRLNELGYKQELRREMTLFKTLAISFSTMTLFTGITPLYGSSLRYAGPASVVWGWVVVTFFTWKVGKRSETSEFFVASVKVQHLFTVKVENDKIFSHVR